MHNCWTPSQIPPTTYRYKVRYIPTNRTWVRTITVAHRGLFLAKLSEWNKADPKNWMYTEVVDNPT